MAWPNHWSTIPWATSRSGSIRPPIIIYHVSRPCLKLCYSHLSFVAYHFECHYYFLYPAIAGSLIITALGLLQWSLKSKRICSVPLFAQFCQMFCRSVFPPLIWPLHSKWANIVNVVNLFQCLFIHSWSPMQCFPFPSGNHSLIFSLLISTKNLMENYVGSSDLSLSLDYAMSSGDIWNLVCFCVDLGLQWWQGLIQEGEESRCCLGEFRLLFHII